MEALKKIMLALKESMESGTANFNASLGEIADWLAQDKPASPALRAKAIEIALMLNSLIAQHNELISKIIRATEVK